VSIENGEGSYLAFLDGAKKRLSIHKVCNEGTGLYYCTVQVSASRAEIDSIFEIFDANATNCRLPEPDELDDGPVVRGKVFIGHTDGITTGSC
jgi:hypothetical protein